MTTYAAWIKFPAGTIAETVKVARVFPRSRKTSRFATIEQAERALEARAFLFKFDTRGEIIDAAGRTVHTIAL